MKTFVRLTLLLFALFFFIKAHWIYWPVIVAGVIIVYCGYLYTEADEMIRRNIKSWLNELPRMWERLFI